MTIGTPALHWQTVTFGTVDVSAVGGLSVKHTSGTSFSCHGWRMTLLTHCPLVCLHHFTDGSTQTLEVVVDNACPTHTMFH